MRVTRGANTLHCRSSFYLCFEHLDNPGAYTASRPETGIPFHLVTPTVLAW